MIAWCMAVGLPVNLGSYPVNVRGGEGGGGGGKNTDVTGEV